jgi:hypothetical protein
MASLKGLKATQPPIMRVDGSAAFITDKRIFTAAPSAADTIDFLCPAGFQLCTLRSVNDDLDTGTALLYSVGYRPVDSSAGPTAVTDYFAAAGQTAFRAAGLVEYSFKPITFQNDVYISILIGTAPAGVTANNELHVIMGGNMIGPK